MNDEAWDFWRQSLEGANVETTPGLPHAGFYSGNRRETYNDSSKLGRRKRVENHATVVAIWLDEDGWHARTDTDDGRTFFSNNLNDIDEFVFPRVCRSPITHDRYLELRDEYGAKAA